MNARAAFFLLGFVALGFLACGGAERTCEGSVESHFSAQDGIEWVVERELDMAQTSIDAAVYTFTSRVLAQALVDAHNRGVRVRVILDPSTASRGYSKAVYLVGNGIEVRTERGAGLMHHKFALIDDTVLITGSFNWTASAETENDENILLLKGFPATCRAYAREFNRIWRDANLYRDEPEESRELAATDLRALKRHVGEEVKVRGKVVRVGHSERSDTYFINFSQDRDGLTVVVFSSAVEKFAGFGILIPDYEGEDVVVSGELISHPQYGLEIIVEEPSQIRVLD